MAGRGDIPARHSSGANKKPASEPAGNYLRWEMFRRSNSLGQCVGELDGVGMVALHAVKLVAAGQHAVEFVDEHGDRLVTFVSFDGRIHFRALDDDVPLGLEERAHLKA